MLQCRERKRFRLVHPVNRVVITKFFVTLLTNEQSGVYSSALVTVAVKAARRHAL